MGTPTRSAQHVADQFEADRDVLLDKSRGNVTTWNERHGVIAVTARKK
jgi:hypothetical protein